MFVQQPRLHQAWYTDFLKQIIAIIPIKQLIMTIKVVIRKDMILKILNENILHKSCLHAGKEKINFAQRQMQHIDFQSWSIMPV